MLRHLASLLTCFATIAAAGSVLAQNATPPKVDFPSASPGATLKQQVGATTIEINYSRPSIRGRQVFGGLVPYGKVWRTGANAATTIAFSTDVKLNGTAVAAGTYELFSIPGQQEWTVIINKAEKQWGAYEYKQQDDVARIAATPVSLARPVETFTIDVNDIRDDSATLNLIWDTTCVPLKIQLDVVDKVAAQIEAVMSSDAPKKPYFQSAMFYFDHGLDLNKALGWMKEAAAAQPDGFWIYYHMARIQVKLGDKAGATASAQKSLEIATKAGGAVGDEYSRLNQALLATLK